MANRIHDTAVIGAGVELGTDNIIGPFAVILGPAVIGSGNWIGPHVAIGTPGEDRDGPHPAAWADAPTGDPARDGYGVRIGDRNRIREYAGIHQGTRRATSVGSDCYLLRGSHVCHDCIVDNGVTLACNAVLGGHSHVWCYANLGLGAVVHQHGRIGPGAMVGMAAAVRRELGAFTISMGVPARVTGINTVGLARLGASDEAIAALEPWVTGRSPVPDIDLPPELGKLITAWAGERDTP
ncbi:MAG: UDP-N-acetylglucosamine acyltransferase [Haloechinothrix sp.]